MMSLELIAILATSLIEMAGLIILGWMARDNGKRLELVEAIDAAVFLQGRQMKEIVDEVRHILINESALSPHQQ